MTREEMQKLNNMLIESMEKIFPKRSEINKQFESLTKEIQRRVPMTTLDEENRVLYERLTRIENHLGLEPIQSGNSN